jgi:anti-sigma B factor antagonist
VNIEKRTIGDVTIVTLAGEFDAASDPATLEKLDAIIEGATRVVFNFRDLTFMTSSALGYLLKITRALRDRGGELVYSEASRPFHNIVEIYEIDRVFRVFPDDQAALAHFGVNER